MRDAASNWFAERTSVSAQWGIDALLAAKRERGETVSVVIPARNESGSVGAVVAGIRTALMQEFPLVDELIVMDSLSTDATAEVARANGALVRSVADVRPDLGVRAGKGEALWKSLFVSSGSILVFIDADLTEWGPHFVTGLLGPMLTERDTWLVRGFYDRLLDVAPGTRSTEGGRVTELMARPLLAARWPDLAAVVQPLAGEWAIRRSLFEQLYVPVGYGVELATLIDTWLLHGLDAIAQVDLGERGHRHQSVHDLGAMALEILQVADVRSWLVERGAEQSIELAQYERGAATTWRMRQVAVTERPPSASVVDEDGDRC
ncbi:MAG: glucosyl-3-phosphoglycerate synthase [Jatrophihabitantaceae bacterium]